MQESKSLENEAYLFSTEQRFLNPAQFIHGDAVDKHTPLVG